MSNHQEINSALGPYRILDLTEGGCMIGARMLGDLGADVVKIEPPCGSPSRIAPFYENIPDPEKSIFWFACNMNKRGITLDINKAEGQEIFKRLVETADVVTESFEPGYMDQLGLGYSDLSKIKPDIIMTSTTPFGQNGPKAHYKGSDLTAWASGNYLLDCGDPDRAPTFVIFPQASLFGGAEAALGTLTAFWYRQITGEGQHVDVSLQECAMAPTFNVPLMWGVSKIEFHRVGGSIFIPSTGVSVRFCYKCKDGYVLLLVQGGNEPYVSSMERLVEWMDEAGMADDWLKKLDFAVDLDATSMKQHVVDRLTAALEKFTETKTKAELYEEGGIKRRILIAPLSTTKDICENPQLRSRDYWVKVLHPELGKALTYCGPFIRLSETPIVYRRRAPLIGEHNEEVYGKELGFSAEKLSSLRQAGVI